MAQSQKQAVKQEISTPPESLVEKQVVEQENSVSPKPTVGRIVHYNDGTNISPAIIVRVLANDTVNLVVFTDYPVGSPILSSEIRCVREVSQGDEPGQWNWPPRV